MEVAVLLGEEDEVVTVRVDRMGHGDELAVSHGMFVRAVSRRNDEVNPIILAVIFSCQSLVRERIIRVVFVLDVVDGWLGRQVQPESKRLVSLSLILVEERVH